MTTAPPTTTRADSTAPAQAGMVLLALILVAAVANLNLAVANVALPSIGEAFDASQTSLNLIAVGYSLGLAASVLYFGAHRRPLRPQADAAPGHRAGHPLQRARRVVAERAGALRRPRRRRGLGGHGLSDHARADHRALVGPGRTRSIALWSGIGGGDRLAGAAAVGLLLEHFWWGSVFLLTLPLAVVALLLAWKLVPAHVNEGTEPVDNLGGVLSVLLVGALIIGINFAAGAELGRDHRHHRWHHHRRRRRVRAPAAPRGQPALRPGHRRPPDLLGRGVRRHHRLRLADGAMFIGQQFLQNVLGYDTLEAGRGDHACRAHDGAGRAPLGQAGRAFGCPRHDAHAATCSCCSGSSRCCCSGRRASRTGRSGSAYALVGIGVGFAGTPASHSLTGSVPVTRVGMASGTADLQRDLGGAIMQSIFGALLGRGLREGGHRGHRRIARGVAGHEQHPGGADQVLRRRRVRRPAVPAVRRSRSSPRRRRRSSRVTSWAYVAGIVAVLLGAALVAFLFPKREEEEALLAAYHQADVAAASAQGSP